MPPSVPPRVAGLVLAAGAGRRFGGPKALVGDWLPQRCATLVEGGCEPVLVVLGAAADAAALRVPAGARVVVADDWDEGMGASLRAGLAAAEDLAPAPDAVVVALVDTPGLTGAVVARLVHAAAPAASGALAQAVYEGRRGHPVLIGRAHWPGVVALARGDRGARDYLAGRDVTAVECGDVGHGRDVDVPTLAP
jgi:CTP:molybdopterin cytidylyltransferase MocA